MHKLDRSSATVPSCLSLCDHRHHSWDDPSSPLDKAQVRQSLGEMQGTLCAYCESEVYSGGHIEHFRRKNQLHHPELTFAWDNLFLSCGSTVTCGHFKDRPGRGRHYDPRDLIKPDQDDPDTFFYFFSSGEIRLRHGLSPSDKRRATETIRVFGLDDGALGASRRRALEQYRRMDPELTDFLDELERRLSHKTQNRELFTIRWKVI